MEEFVRLLTQHIGKNSLLAIELVLFQKAYSLCSRRLPPEKTIRMLRRLHKFVRNLVSEINDCLLSDFHNNTPEKLPFLQQKHVLRFLNIVHLLVLIPRVCEETFLMLRNRLVVGHQLEQYLFMIAVISRIRSIALNILPRLTVGYTNFYNLCKKSSDYEVVEECPSDIIRWLQERCGQDIVSDMKLSAIVENVLDENEDIGVVLKREATDLGLSEIHRQDSLVDHFAEDVGVAIDHTQFCRDPTDSPSEKHANRSKISVGLKKTKKNKSKKNGLPNNNKSDTVKTVTECNLDLESNFMKPKKKLKQGILSKGDVNIGRFVTSEQAIGSKIPKKTKKQKLKENLSPNPFQAILKQATTPKRLLSLLKSLKTVSTENLKAFGLTKKGKVDVCKKIKRTLNFIKKEMLQKPKGCKATKKVCRKQIKCLLEDLQVTV